VFRERNIRVIFDLKLMIIQSILIVIHFCILILARSKNNLTYNSSKLHHPDTTFKVFFIWSSSLKPQNTIIRNKGLLDFLNSASTSEGITSKKGWLESSGDDGIPPRLKELKLWSPKL